jgi:hypothetical protein
MNKPPDFQLIIMLPSIKEDTDSQVVHFTPRSVSRKLRSRRNFQSDLLQRKLKELQGPKMRYPDLLITYFENKKKTNENLSSLSFPGLEDLPSCLKGLLSQSRPSQAEKLRNTTPLKQVKFKQKALHNAPLS